MSEEMQKEDLLEHELDNENDSSVDEVEIISVPIPDTLSEVKEPEELKGPFYRTGEVATKFGIDRQTILRYTKVFQEFLSVKQETNGYFLYTEDAIKQIAFIQHDRQKHNRTFPAELEYLRSQYGSRDRKLAMGGAVALEEVLKAATELFATQTREIIKAEMDKQMLAIESREHSLDEMSQKFDEKNREILEKNQELLDRLNQKMERQEEAYTTALLGKDKEIERLQQQLQEKEAALNEATSKKRWFFGKK